MIIYFIIFILSLSGISVIALRHKEEIMEFNFAIFMNNAIGKFLEWWYYEAHADFFKFLEKFLRRSRIWVLRVESFLFRKVHVVRGISERNGGSNGEHNDANSGAAPRT